MLSIVNVQPGGCGFGAVVGRDSGRGVVRGRVE